MFGTQKIKGRKVKKACFCCYGYVVELFYICYWFVTDNRTKRIRIELGMGVGQTENRISQRLGMVQKKR